MAELEDEVGDAGTQIRLDRSEGRLLVTLAGEIDLSSQPALEAVLDEIATGPVADTKVDLAGVTFLSSTGLEFLARLHRQVTQAGHAVTVHDPPPPALRVLNLAGFTKVLTIFWEPPPTPS